MSQKKKKKEYIEFAYSAAILTFVFKCETKEADCCKDLFTFLFLFLW